MKLWRKTLALALLPLATGLAHAQGAWMELLTNGVPSDMARFYRDVFGWTSRPLGEGARAPILLLRDERPVAGIVYHDAGPATEVRSCWVGFFPQSDPAAGKDKLTHAGARLLSPAHAGAAEGRTQILLADLHGAPFGLIAADAAFEGSPGFWPQLLSPRPLDSIRFYTANFGGEARPENRTPLFPADFQLVRENRVWAGVSLQPGGGRAGWVVTVGVADIDATVRAARKAGARLLNAPKLDLIGGRVAVLADPAGGIFGLHEAIPLGVAPAAGVNRSTLEIETLSP